MNGRSGETAIDLGCGTGNVAAMLAKRYATVRAIDISQPMVDLARRKYPNPRISFEQGDVTAVTGQYDLVVSIMVLHHVPDHAREDLRDRGAGRACGPGCRYRTLAWRSLAAQPLGVPYVARRPSARLATLSRQHRARLG
jgi:ubiquinone/menaquinone biosynthesis C-methylase UbiE